jgi:hypothetical protein
MLRVATICSLLAFFGPQTKNVDEGPSSKVAELKALDHYVGAWEVEFTNRELPFISAKATAKWVLDGRFVEQNGELENKDGTKFKLKTLFTFDAKRNAYRSWIFTSDGSVTECDCTWDAKAKIMTSISKNDEAGGFSTTTADFSMPGIETWKIAIADANGKVRSEITGKNTRTKK